MKGPRHWNRRGALALLLALGVLISQAAPALAGAPAGMPVPPGEAPPPQEAPRLAEPTVSREEAIAKARELFSIPADLGDPSVHLWQSSDPGSQPTWNLSWSTQPEVEPALRYEVGVDALTGEVRHFSFNRQSEEQPALSFTRNEAVQRAGERLEKLAAPYVDQLQLRDGPLTGDYFHPGAPAVYTFRWERLAQGIPVQGQGVTVAIDARTGELTQFNLNWNRDQIFQPPQEMVDQAGAVAAYREQFSLGLVYRRFWDPATEKPQWKLVYAPLGSYPMVDAATGRLLNPRGKPADLTGWDDLRRLPIPAQPYVAPERPLT